MKPTGDGFFYVDVGRGKLEPVNVTVADYIWRLRQVIKDAGLSTNPRHNVRLGFTSAQNDVR